VDQLRPPPNLGDQIQALPEIAGAQEARQQPQRRGEIAPRRRLENGGEGAARAEILRRQQPEERPGAGQHDTAGSHHPSRFQQDLCRARGHHARERPALDRKRPLEGAGGQDHALRPQHADGAADGDADLALPRELPDRRLRHIACGAGMERLHQRSAAPVCLAEDRRIAQRRFADRAIDLSAGRRLLVENYGVEAELGRRDRRRHPRRARADHRELVTLLDERLAHGPTARRPRCVSMRMPSRTGTRQACRLPMPSIATRQSKQTPIMQ